MCAGDSASARTQCEQRVLQVAEKDTLLRGCAGVALIGLLAIKPQLALLFPVAQKAGVKRYATGEGLPRGPVPVTARSVELGAAAVTFTSQELSALKLTPHRLVPFEFTAGQAEALVSQTSGQYSPS